MKSQSEKLINWIWLSINTILSIFLLVETYFSLRWRMVHDGPILYYMGFLIDNYQAIPYRDFFDMNMPGAHWLNALTGSIFGFTDSGFQLGNVLLLSLTLILIFMWLRSFGLLPAWTGAILFGIIFLQYGPAMSMQREFLTLHFLLIALLAFPLENGSAIAWRYITAGMFVSLAVLIKPQSGLILVVLLIIDYIRSDNRGFLNWFKHSLKFLLWLGFGFVFPLVATALYFLFHQAMGAFYEIAMGYWPLYSDINARLELASGWQKFQMTLAGMISVGIQGLFFLPALISLFGLISTSKTSLPNKLKAYLMAGGVVVSFIEVIIANKYWEYHWLPMIFFLILLSAVGLSISSSKHRWIVVSSLLLACAFTIRPADIFINQINREPMPLPQGGRVDDIAKYLEDNLEPGDTVQPLDWSNGAVQAMLVSGAKPATRYLYDFHFYHHISTPTIQHLRIDFLSQLARVKPKIVIQFYDGRPWVNGIDTTRTFSELDTFLEQHYYIDKDRNGYRLWMRK